MTVFFLQWQRTKAVIMVHTDRILSFPVSPSLLVQSSNTNTSKRVYSVLGASPISVYVLKWGFTC